MCDEALFAQAVKEGVDEAVEGQNNYGDDLQVAAVQNSHRRQRVKAQVDHWSPADLSKGIVF